MKTIKLTEGQLHIVTRLIEDTNGAPDFEDGDIKAARNNNSTCSLVNSSSVNLRVLRRNRINSLKFSIFYSLYNYPFSVFPTQMETQK